MIAPFSRIKAPIIYILGNHETYLGVDKVERVIRKTKIKLLRDQIVEIGGLQIIGIDYPPREQSKNLEPVLETMDKGKPTILLFHRPSQVETARRYPIALQLSGHCHNGQMYPMQIFNYLAFKGLSHGLHQFGDFTIYTTSGVGTWGPPMRIGSTAEIVIITLQRPPAKPGFKGRGAKDSSGRRGI
jgi:uncharacterized protein